MSNLGLYQTFASVSKKVGGPKVLIGILMTAGYVVIRSVETGGKQVIKLVKEKANETTELSKIYSFAVSGVGDNSLKFEKNDTFIVAAAHDEVILIEKQNDNNNPYFVSLAWLNKVSNYKIWKRKESKMKTEFWDGFDYGFDYGFLDGAGFAIERLSTIHNKKLAIAIITSSLIGAGITVGMIKLIKCINYENKLIKVQSWEGLI